MIGMIGMMMIDMIGMIGILCMKGVIGMIGLIGMMGMVFKEKVIRISSTVSLSTILGKQFCFIGSGWLIIEWLQIL